MECVYCGQKANPNQDFCTNCGAMLKQSSANQSQDIYTKILKALIAYIQNNGEENVPSLKDEDPNVAYNVLRSIIDYITQCYQDNENYRISGEFIASLTNDILLNRDVIEMSLSENVDYIGANHSRGKLSITSSVGKNLGDSMSGGEIIVKGSAGESAGARMSRGRIHIQGNAKGIIGPKISSGDIIVDGAVNGSITKFFNGTSITIGGDLTIKSGEDIADYMEGGEVLIKGNLINKSKNTIIIGQRFYAGIVRIEGKLIGPIKIDKPVYDGQIIVGKK